MRPSSIALFGLESPARRGGLAIVRATICAALAVLLAAPPAFAAPPEREPTPDAPRPDPKEVVVELPAKATRRPAPADPEPERGIGKLAAGIVLTSVGGLGTIAGGMMAGVIQALSGGQARGTWALVLPGIAVLGAGVPLTVVGAIRHRRWKAWRARHPFALQPMIGRTARGTWSAGIELRF